MDKKVKYSVTKDKRNPGKWVVTRNGRPMDTQDNLDAGTAADKARSLQIKENKKDAK